MALTDQDADALFANVEPSKPTLTPESADALFERADRPVGPPSGTTRAFDALQGVRNWMDGLGAATDAAKAFTFGGLSEGLTNRYRDAYGLLLGKDPSEIDIDLGGFEATRFAEDQFAEGQFQQDRANQLKPKGGAQEFLFDAAQAIIQMAPAVATSYATRSPNAALAVMGTQVYGDAYGRAKAAGKSAEQAKTDALVALVTEIGPEKAFAFFDNLVFGAGARNILTKGLVEAPSEGVTSILQIADEMLRQGKDVSPQEAIGRVLRDMALGFTVGSALATPSALGREAEPTAPEPGPPTAEELAVDYAASREYDRTIARQRPQVGAAAAIEGEPAPVEPQAPPVAPEPVQAAAPVELTPEQKETEDFLQQAGVEAVEPAALEIDPGTFQYKAGADEQGVLDTLKSVREWDPRKAGVIMVYEYADGRRVVADGHQRVGLVRRLHPEGGVPVLAYVLRESEGYTPADARRIAAETNIAQGSGSSVDAAKIIREIAPEERDAVLSRLPVGSAIVRDALGLAKLGEVPFMNVVNEQVQPAHGALVGERFEDPQQQEAAMQILIRIQPTSADQVRAMLEDMAAAGFQKTEQGGLFGDDMLESLIGERSKILSAALTNARKDKALFGKLVGSETKIAQAGNVLASQTNQQILQQTQEVLATLIKSVNTTPQLNGALNELASQVKSGELTVRKAAGQFLEIARAYQGEGSATAPAEPTGERGPEQPAEPTEGQGSLIAPPTPGETLAAAQQGKDDQRNGLGTDLVPPEEGGGELFAGNEPGQRPEQATIDEPEIESLKTEYTRLLDMTVQQGVEEFGDSKKALAAIAAVEERIIELMGEQAGPLLLQRLKNESVARGNQAKPKKKKAKEEAPVFNPDAEVTVNHPEGTDVMAAWEAIERLEELRGYDMEGVPADEAALVDLEIEALERALAKVGYVEEDFAPAKSPGTELEVEQPARKKTTRNKFLQKRARERESREREQPATRRGTPEFNRLSFTERPTHFHDIWSENGIDPDAASTWPTERQVARARKILMERYGFGEIHIDPKMPKIKARDQMADAYRNLKFMTHVLGLPATAIGLNRTLALTLVKQAPFLGALVNGNMIVMPGRSNSFAHEWGHALDYWLLNRIAPGEYAGLSGRVREDGVEPPPASTEEAFVSLMDNLFFEQSQLAAEHMRATELLRTGTDRQKAQAQQTLDKIEQGNYENTNAVSQYYRSAKEYGNPKYWTKPTEMLARAFEAYVANRIERMGGTNEFLTKGDENYLDNAEERLAKTFPKLEERERIFAAFDRLFRQIAAEDAFRGAPEQMPGPGDKVDLRKFVIHSEQGELDVKAFFRIHKDLAASVMDFVRREKDKPAHPETWPRRLDGLRTLMFDTIRSRARVLEKLNPQSKAMRAFFNTVLLEPGAKGRTVGETFTEEVSRLYQGFVGTENNIYRNNGLQKMTDAENIQLRDVLLGNEVPDAPANIKRAAAAIRKLLEKHWYEMQRAGINVGAVADKGYLPRTWKEAQILADRESFRADATRAMRDYQFPHELAVKGRPRDEWAERIVSNQRSWMLFLFYASKTPGVTDARDAMLAEIKSARNIEDPDEHAAAVMAAQVAFVEAIYDDVAQTFGEIRAAAWDFSIARADAEDYFMPGQPGVPVTKGRTLVGDFDDAMSKWLERDVSVMLERYARSTARKIAYVKRFGEHSERYNAFIDQMTREGVHKIHQDEARKLVDKVLGRERHLLPVRGQAFFDWGHTLGYMVLLNLATFSSLAEASTYGIRAGDLKQSFAPIHMALRQLTKGGRAKARELRNLALTMNIIGGRVTETVLNNMVGGDYTYSPRARGAMTRFFETTLLSQLTEAQRAYGVQVADQYLRKYAKDWIADRDRGEAENVLREHGIDNFEEFSTWLLQDDHYPTPEELYDRDGFPTPRGSQYMLAVRRFVDQGIQNPDISLRPELASNPFGRLMYGIMAFSYAFYENVIKREVKVMQRKGLQEGAKWAVTRTVPALMLLGIQQIVVSTIRELIFHADKYEDMDDEEALERMIAIGINRAYGYGGLDPMIQYALGLKYQRGLAETAVGAVPGYFMDNADNLFKLFTESNSENTTTAEYRAAEAIYNLAVAPALSFGASWIGAAGPAARIALGTPIVYSVRSLREEFANVFGNKPDRSDEVDEELSDLRSEYQKKLDAISQQLRETPADQWDAELERLRQEYPVVLRDAQFDRYSPGSSENVRKGRVGKPKVLKSRVQFKGLPEEYGKAPEESAYNGALRLIIRGKDLTYGKLFEEIPEGLSPTLDRVRATRKTEAKPSRGFLAELREEIEDLRRELKRERIKAIRRLEKGAGGEADVAG